jgi:PDZ domain
MHLSRLVTGILFGACFLYAAEPEVPDFSAAAVQAQVEKLNATDHAERVKAGKFLSTWSEKEPELAKKMFLSLWRESQEPEIRERSLQLLKPIAAREFGNFGEGFLGITMGVEILVKLPNNEKPCYGLQVSAVTKDSPAEKANIQPGDVIVRLNDHTWPETGQIIHETMGLSAKIRSISAGSTAKFGIWRSNKELLNIEAKLTRRPGNLENIPMQFMPNGGFKVDELELQKLAEEEKNSSAYFKEWLEREVSSLPQNK